METTFLVTKLIRDQRTYIATALYQERKLLEISLDSQQEESILGNIYVGRVKDIVKNLNAAFIEIAPGVPCYYGLENLKNPLYVKKINSPRMVQGDEVVVQVVREKSKGKPPRVSTNLTFTGKYLVLTSENTTVGFSKKLDFETKNRLKSTLNFEKMREFGVIVRTNAAFASIDEILAEYHVLKQEYLQIKETFLHRTVFSCLRKRMSEYLCSLQNLSQEQLNTIITDDLVIYEQIRDYLQEFQPENSQKLRLYEDK